MAEGRRRAAQWLVFAGALACVSAVVALAGWCDDRAEPIVAPRPASPPSENRWLEVPVQNPTEPRPLVLAWEESRLELPTFALYSDGRWLWHPLGDRSAPFRTGRVSVDEARSIHARFLDAELVSIAPWLTRTPGVVDQNRTTFCVARSEHGAAWACASLEGMESRAAPDVEIDQDDAGVRYQRAREGAPSAVGPIPAPLRAAADVLASFDASDGRVIARGPEPRVPAHDDVLEVRRAFLRFVGVIP